MDSILADGDAAVDAYYAIEALCLGKGVSPLDLTDTKDFLHYHVAISRGRIHDKRITVDSVNTFKKCFFAKSARMIGNQIDEEDRGILVGKEYLDQKWSGREQEETEATIRRKSASSF